MKSVFFHDESDEQNDSLQEYEQHIHHFNE